ncbi:MAG TPA: GntR family transcriptional regulator [Deinococcales bacterium]|nr:GntR family transcriptional regulator [Deinococcales bacterium]
MAVDSQARPIYVTILEDIRREILNGNLGLGDQIPTEAALCERYGVSRMTVRQALDSLTASGYLIRKRGKGTFVSSTKAERSASRLLGFEEDTLNHALRPTTEVLGAGWVDAGREDQQLLGLPSGSRVWQVDRLRSVNDELIGINHVVLLETWGKKLREQDYRRSLYSILRQSLADEVTEAEQRIEATAADDGQAGLLGIAVGAPLLRIVRTTYLERHGLIGLTRTFYRGDRYFLSLTVSRGSLDQGSPEPAAAAVPAPLKEEK